MKKILLFAVVALMGTSAFAQADYNKWSIDFGVGANKAWKNFSVPCYSTNDMNFFTGDIGVRFMTNEYFGLKLDYGYNKLTEGDNSLDFETTYMRSDLQAVINAARVLHFEDWTRTIGLLLHGGGGVSWATNDIYDGTDWSMNLMAGATVQFRLSDRVALNLDGTVIAPTAKVDRTFDGAPISGYDKGLLFNGTVGLSVYLGKHQEHADWYISEDNMMADMDSKYANLEGMINDLKNGQVDPNEVDRIKNNLNDLASTVDGLDGQDGMGYHEFVKRLSEDGFTSVFFGYDKATVDSYGTTNLNFLNTYLQNNPNITVEVRGYADEKGSDDYNQKLSEKRAESAAQILINAGIDASRISTVGMGEDTTITQDTAQARKMARRASFVIK